MTLLWSLPSVCAVLALLASAPAAQHSGWGYDDADEWGHLKDAQGHLLYPQCDGARQSPVQLSQVEADGSLKPLHPAWPNSLRYSVTNNGHTIQFTPLDLDNVQAFTDPNTGAAYALRQFHFHSPSEHAWGGRLLDAEVHMVHSKISGPDSAEPLAVVGVGFDVTQVATGVFFDEFWGPLTNATVDTTVEYVSKLNFRAALPLSQAYVTYPGSLTTPPCAETVQWYVMAEPQSLSVGQLDVLRQRLGLTNATGNRRPLQSLNGRRLRLYDGAAAAADDSHRVIGALIGIGCGAVVAAAIIAVIIARFCRPAHKAADVEMSAVAPKGVTVPHP